MSMPAIQPPRTATPRGDSSATLPPEDVAWAAVQRRDTRFDGRFVYAVRSTGVYCRPSCPSRRPRRAQVSFFAAAGDAERAGFRECRRCRPRSGGTTEAPVQRARAHLEAHAEERVTLTALARVAGLSASRLQRTFKAALGMSPREYQDALRVGRLKARLRSGDTVSRATYDAGYGSSSRVYERADAKLGMTPGAYRRLGAGVRIGYEIVDSPLGRLLVGMTERGVCSVALGDDDAELERLLRYDFPKAEVARGAPAHREWISAVVEQLHGREPGAQVPIDVRGTTFQWQVWHALQRIPAGQTKSYGEIAASLGRPTATRAVARACASNRVAIVIPCHRAIRADGSLSGYRWGVERKRRLLEAERQGTTETDARRAGDT